MDIFIEGGTPQLRKQSVRNHVIDRATQLGLQDYGTKDECIEKACLEIGISKKQFIKFFI